MRLKLLCTTKVDVVLALIVVCQGRSGLMIIGLVLRLAMVKGADGFKIRVGV